MARKPKSSPPNTPAEKRIVKVRVQAGARQESVSRAGEAWVIAVKEPAEANRANARVRAVLAEALAVPLAAVRLMTGHHRPSKMFEILQPEKEKIP